MVGLIELITLVGGFITGLIAGNHVLLPRLRVWFVDFVCVIPELMLDMVVAGLTLNVFAFFYAIVDGILFLIKYLKFGIVLVGLVCYPAVICFGIKLKKYIQTKNITI